MEIYQQSTAVAEVVVDMKKKRGKKAKKASPKKTVDVDEEEPEEPKQAVEEEQPELETAFVLDADPFEEADTDTESTTDTTTDGVAPRKVMSLISEGVYTATMHQGVHVSELPLGCWTLTYKTWLDTLVKKLIDDIKDNNDALEEKISFGLPGFSNPSIKALRLRASAGLNNMVLLDENMKPTKFDTIEQALDRFYDFRLPLYEKRRVFLIKQLKEKIQALEDKRDFLKAVVNKTLILSNQSKTAIKEQCTKLNLNPEFLKLSMSSLTQEDLEELKEQIFKVQNEMVELLKLSAADLWKRDLLSFLKVYRATIKK